MRRRVTVLGSLLTAAAIALVVPATAAAAVSAPAVGNDVSYPQCASSTSSSAGALPTTAAFGIVGLNKGLANNFNPCSDAELAWAQLLQPGTSAQPASARYLNTGNAALAASWWPSSNVTKDGTPVPSTHGTCAHKAGIACAYVYGYSMAHDDFVKAGSPTGATWWLDVETSNTWQKDLTANTGDLVGMVDYLKAQGGTVGLYSTAKQWAAIAGKTSSSSHLAGLASWIAGSSKTAAPAVCEGSGLTPSSRVSLVQYHVGDFDTDYSCGIQSPVTPTFTGTLKSGHKLTSSVAGWAPAATYSYQWYRGTVAISGATKSYHTLVTADSGKTIKVKVTAKKAGYTTASSTSAAKSVSK